MRYLSFDIEATGLGKEDFLIEFAALPFDASKGRLEESLGWQILIRCPSFDELRPRLNPWVIENNRNLIEKAHAEGVTQEVFKESLTRYLKSSQVVQYFGGDKPVLFGKSVASIDIPFLKRDLGWDWFEQHFSHRQLDLSAVSYSLIDQGILPKSCSTGSGLMKYLGMGEVAHTALSDARNTAIMYLTLIGVMKK